MEVDERLDIEAQVINKFVVCLKSGDEKSSSDLKDASTELLKHVEFLHKSLFLSKLDKILSLAVTHLKATTNFNISALIVETINLVPKSKLKIPEIVPYILTLVNCIKPEDNYNEFNEKVFRFLFPVLPAFCDLLKPNDIEKIIYAVNSTCYGLLKRYVALEQDNSLDHFLSFGCLLENLSLVTVACKMVDTAAVPGLRDLVEITLHCVELQEKSPTLNQIRLLTKFVFVCLSLHKRKDCANLISAKGKKIAGALVYLLEKISTDHLKERIDVLSLFRTLLSSDLRSSIFFYCDLLVTKDIIYKFKRPYGDFSIEGNSFCELSFAVKEAYPHEYSSLAFMTLADFFHHARAIIPARKLSKVMQLFLRCFHSKSLPLTLQNISVRVIRSMVDTLYNAQARGEQIGLDLRNLISIVLLSLIEKVKHLQRLKQKLTFISEERSLKSKVESFVCRNSFEFDSNDASHFFALFETVATVIKSSLWCISNLPLAYVKGGIDTLDSNVEYSGLLNKHELVEMPYFFEACLDVLDLYENIKIQTNKKRTQQYVGIITGIVIELLPPDFLEIMSLSFESFFHKYALTNSLNSLFETLFTSPKLSKIWVVTTFDFICQNLRSFAGDLYLERSTLLKFAEFPDQLFIKRVRVLKNISSVEGVKALNVLFQLSVRYFSLISSKTQSKDYEYVVPSTVVVSCAPESNHKTVPEPIRKLVREEKSNWGISRVLRIHLEHIILFCLVVTPHMTGSVMQTVSRKNEVVKSSSNFCIYLQMLNFLLAHLIRRTTTKKYCQPFIGTLGMPILQGLKKLLNNFRDKEALILQPGAKVEQEIIVETILFVTFLMSKHDLRANLSVVEEPIKLALLSYHTGNVDLCSLALRIIDVWLGNMDRQLVFDKVLFAKAATKNNQPTVGRVLLTLLSPNNSEISFRALKLVGQIGGSARIEAFKYTALEENNGLPYCCSKYSAWLSKIAIELDLKNIYSLKSVLFATKDFIISRLFENDKSNEDTSCNLEEFMKFILLLFNKLKDSLNADVNIQKYSKLWDYFSDNVLYCILLLTCDKRLKAEASASISELISEQINSFQSLEHKEQTSILFDLLHRTLLKGLSTPNPKISASALKFLRQLCETIDSLGDKFNLENKEFMSCQVKARINFEENCRGKDWFLVFGGLLGLQVFLENIKIVKGKHEKQEALTSLTKTLILSLKNFTREHGKTVLFQLENCLDQLLTTTVNQRLDVTPMIEQLAVCLMASLERCRVVAVACLNKVADLLGIPLKVLLGRATRAMKYLREYIIARSFKIMTPKKQISFLSLISAFFKVEPSPLTLTPAESPSASRGADTEAYVRSVNYNLYKRLAQTLYEAINLTLNDNMSNESLSLSYAYPESRIGATDSEDLIYQRSPPTLFLGNYPFKEVPHDIKLRLSVHKTIKSLLTFPRLSQIYQVCLEREGFYTDLVGKVVDVLFSSVGCAWEEVRESAYNLLNVLPILKLSKSPVDNALNTKYLVSQTQLESALAVQLSRLETLDVLSHSQVLGVNIIVERFFHFLSPLLRDSAATKLLSHLRWFGAVNAQLVKNQGLNVNIDLAWLEAVDPAAKRYDSSFCTRVYDAELFGRLLSLYCRLSSDPSLINISIEIVTAFQDYSKNALSCFQKALLSAKQNYSVNATANFTSSVMVQATPGIVTSPVLQIFVSCLEDKNELLMPFLIKSPELALDSCELLISCIAKSTTLKETLAANSDTLFEVFLLTEDLEFDEKSTAWSIFGLRLFNLLSEMFEDIPKVIQHLNFVTTSKRYSQIFNKEWRFSVAQHDFCHLTITVLLKVILRPNEISHEVLHQAIASIFAYEAQERLVMSCEIRVLIYTFAERYVTGEQIKRVYSRSPLVVDNYIGAFLREVFLSLSEIGKLKFLTPLKILMQNNYDSWSNDIKRIAVLSFLKVSDIKLLSLKTEHLTISTNELDLLLHTFNLEYKKAVSPTEISKMFSVLLEYNEWNDLDQNLREILTKKLCQVITKERMNISVAENTRLRFLRTFFRKLSTTQEESIYLLSFYCNSQKHIRLLWAEDFKLILPTLHTVVFGVHSSMMTVNIAITVVERMIKLIRRDIIELPGFYNHIPSLYSAEIFIGKLCCHLFQNPFLQSTTFERTCALFLKVFAAKKLFFGTNRISMELYETSLNPNIENFWNYVNKKVNKLSNVDMKKEVSLKSEELLFLFNVFDVISQIYLKADSVRHERLSQLTCLPDMCKVAVVCDNDEGLMKVLILIEQLQILPSCDKLLALIYLKISNAVAQELTDFVFDFSVIFNFTGRYKNLLKISQYLMQHSLLKRTLVSNNISLQREIASRTVEIFSCSVHSMKAVRSRFMSCFRTKDEVSIVVAVKCRCKISMLAQKILSESTVLFDSAIRCLGLLEIYVQNTGEFMNTYFECLVVFLKRSLHVQVSNINSVWDFVTRLLSFDVVFMQEQYHSLLVSLKEWDVFFGLYGFKSIERGCLEVVKVLFTLSKVELSKENTEILLSMSSFGACSSHKDIRALFKNQVLTISQPQLNLQSLSQIQAHNLVSFSCLNLLRYSPGSSEAINSIAVARLNDGKRSITFASEDKKQIRGLRLKEYHLQLASIKEIFVGSTKNIRNVFENEVYYRDNAYRILTDLKRGRIEGGPLLALPEGDNWNTTLTLLDDNKDIFSGYLRLKHKTNVSQSAISYHVRGLLNEENIILTTALSRYVDTQGVYAMADKNENEFSVPHTCGTAHERKPLVFESDPVISPSRAFATSQLRGQYEANVPESLFFDNAVSAANPGEDLFDEAGFMELFEGNELGLDPATNEPTPRNSPLKMEQTKAPKNCQHSWKSVKVEEEEVRFWLKSKKENIKKLTQWETGKAPEDDILDSSSFEFWLKFIRSGKELKPEKMKSASEISSSIVKKFAVSNELFSASTFTELVGVTHLTNLQRLVETDDTITLLNSIKQNAAKIAELSTKKSKAKIDTSQVWRRLANWRITLPNELESVSEWSSILHNRLLLFSLMTGTLSQIENTDHAYMTQDHLWTKTLLARQFRAQKLPLNSYKVVSSLPKDLTSMSLKMTIDDYILNQVEKAYAVLAVNDQQNTYLGYGLAFNTLTGSLQSLQSLNIDHVQKRKLISDIFRGRARLYAQVRNIDEPSVEVEDLYSRSIQTFEQNASTWLEWHDFLASSFVPVPSDSMTPELKGFDSVASVTMCGAILQAVCLGSIRARLLLPKVFWNLHIESELIRGEDVLKNVATNQVTNEETIFNILIQYIQIIPTWIWLPYIPQLLNGVTKAERLTSYHILHNLLYKYPQALYSSLRVKLMEIRVQGVDEAQNGASTIDIKTNEIYNNVRQLYNKLHKEHPKVANETQLWLEEFGNNCKLLLPMQEFENAVCKLYSRCLKIATGTDESITKMTKITGGSRLLFVWYILKKLCSQLKPSNNSSDPKMNDLKLKFLSDFNPPETRFSFLRKSSCTLEKEQEALTSKALGNDTVDFSISAILTRLWNWKVSLQNTWRDKYEGMYFRNISFKLRNISFNALYVPGVYKQDMQLTERNFKSLPLLSFIDSKVVMITENEMPQIQVGFHGSDGITRHFVVQTLSRSFSSFAPDFRSKQLHEVVEAFMRRDSLCVRRNYTLETPIYLSINTKMRLQSIDENLTSVENFFYKNCSDGKLFPQEIATKLSYDKIATSREEVVTSIIDKVNKNLYKDELVRYSKSLLDFYKRRRRLAYLFGVSATMAALLGCGDRKANQTMLSLRQRLALSERQFYLRYSALSNNLQLQPSRDMGLAPFRLGRNVQEVLGEVFIHGPFLNTLSILTWLFNAKENRPVLHNLCLLLIRDDIVEATLAETPTSRNLEGIKEVQSSLKLHSIAMANIATFLKNLDFLAPLPKHASPKHNSGVEELNENDIISDKEVLNKLNKGTLHGEPLNLDKSLVLLLDEAKDIKRVSKHDAAWMAWM